MEDRYLFRGKRIDNGEWVEWNMITGIPHDIHILDNTICQCTGLKDKNGKLIWENDLLDGYIYPFLSDGNHNYFAQVCWCDNNPSFAMYIRKHIDSNVRGISEGFMEIMEDWEPDNWKIIGNIFNNPELLKEVWG